jgi:sulfatase modifying factor 1
MKFLPFLALVVSASAQPLTYRYFNVTEDAGKVVAVTPQPDASPPRWARDVSVQPGDWSHGPDRAQPFFQGPVPFVIPPVDAGETFGKHNHQPSLVWLENGDLLAIWYSTPFEESTELTVMASRLRAGETSWAPASVFFKAADRNMHGSSVFRDAAGTLFHINGLGKKGTTGWKDLAFLLRSSSDNGVTWTPPRICGAQFQGRQQIISGTIFTRAGLLVQPCDAVPGPEGGSNLQISADRGQTWTDPGAGKPAPTFTEGATGEGTIAGIHTGVVELQNDELLAFGRGNNIDGHMPRSVSHDSGKTWTYSATEFPPIGGGQRLILKRLREGPLLLVSFTSGDRQKPRATGLAFPDGAGGTFTGYGMYAALSFDDGATWPVRRLLTPGSGELDGGAWTGKFTATRDQAEPAGYLAATQTPDGVIHLISSRLHYRFNLAWLSEIQAISK